MTTEAVTTELVAHVHSLPLTLQEHYMASLMPLQKSITPWKVEPGVFWGGSFQSPYQEGKA